MDSASAHSTDVFENIISYLYRSIGLVLYISGNVGVLISVWIFHWKPWRKNVCVFYFLVSLFANFVQMNNFLLANIANLGFQDQLINNSPILCKLTNYVAFVFDEISPSILVFASIDRLLISSADVNTRLYSSRRLAYFSLSVSSAIWIVFFIHILVRFDIYPLGPFTIICIYEPGGIYAEFLNNSQLAINLALFLLMVILSAFSFRNVRRLQLLPRQQRQGRRTMHKRDFQLLRCLFVKNIVHIVFHGFMVAYAVYQAITTSHLLTAWEQARKRFLFNFCIFMHLIPSCTDFYIYVIFSKAFRQELKRMLTKTVGRNLVADRDEDKELEPVGMSMVGPAALPPVDVGHSRVDHSL